METDTTTLSPESLRAEMVAKVRAGGWAERGEVERVLRDTPRHRFLPDADLELAYHPYRAVVTHRFDNGRSLSCASAPWLVAGMLDQLDVQPGHRVLEIGAGTGYNACLLAQLTGRADLVTTVDINPDVAARASRALADTGFGGVHVVTGDGVLGYPDHAPYDRMIATVSPWDLPAPWWQQLAPGGRLVAPLRWRGQGRSVAFTRTGDRLVSDSLVLCGFVYLVGDGEGELSGAITSDGLVTLHWDRDQDVRPDALLGVLDQPRITTWSDVTLGRQESHEDLWLRLTATDPRACRLGVTGDVPPEVCDPVPGYWRMALVDDGTLAYLTLRRVTIADEARCELGVIGHGPAAAELTEHLCGEIRAWAPDRHRHSPTLTVHPAGAPDSELAGTAIDKTHSRFVLTYDDPPR
ncbi:methyltransferase, FxLD system [Actinoalloteichus caeruleus]|uniref:methyltransferase, FxLD system n=1 Tax=Actinoalloteichus cyanogriseus TaxID=2893586 RepID=UPI0004AA457F|nr:methyltransferase, FxLD system [Actinoalloteichus caeruleus]